MSPVAAEVAAPRPGRLATESNRLFEPSGSTLEERILGAWEDLGLEGRAECPVCRDALEPAGCTGCGSELS